MAEGGPDRGVPGALEAPIPRRVFLEPLWNLHALQHQMLAYPPDGYEFVTLQTPPEKLFHAAARWGSARSLLKVADSLVPVGLAKALLQKRRKLAAETVLTYAVDHLVFRPEPWVVEVEYAGALLGGHPRHLRRFWHIAQRTLSSPLCRRILCWSQVGRQSLADLGGEAFEHKIDVVYYAVPPKGFARQCRRGPVKLLLVGSGTSKGAFEGRGSEVFEVFRLLRERYPSLELVVRSDVPVYVKRRYGGMEGVRIIDQVVPREVLEQEFQTADIFLFPSYHTLPSTILEAMSYELPVVTIASWANAEYVEDGKTGLVTPRSGKVPPYFADTRQPSFLASSFSQAMRAPDRDAVVALVATVATLIESPELRQRLGKAARWEVEQGKFSLKRMNAHLARIFGEAIGHDEHTRCWDRQ